MATKNADNEKESHQANIPEVSENIKKFLNPIELEMYEEWRMELFQWVANVGKNPEFGEGYPNSSITQHAYRIDRFASWVFAEDGFSTSFSHDQANRYWTQVLQPDSNKLATNRKDANSIALIYKMRAYKSDDCEEWSIPNSQAVYNQINKESRTTFTDWFTYEELDAIKHAALALYAVPNREDMQVEEQDEWATHLAQRLKKPKGELTEDDWQQANSYKIPSLVYVSCDVGFRPKEIERSRWGWFDLDERVIRIPKSESTKNSDRWQCYLSDESARLMDRYKSECYGDEEPDPDESIWMTREENPYSADSLRDPTLQNLMEEAGINTDERETGWYMIRRGVGTDIGTQRGLNSVMNQLRIKSVETAKRYVRHDERGVRDWLSSR